MRKFIYSVTSLLLFAVTASAQTNVFKKINIIPAPSSTQVQKGFFPLGNRTVIFISANVPDSKGTFLAEQLRKYTGYDLTVAKTSDQKNNIINLFLNRTEDQALGKEGYKMNVSTDAITISANEPNGLFYGIETLLQLLPPKKGGNELSVYHIEVPAVEIIDNPRFEWRGVMLDVSRHFFPKDYIESLIDHIASYKYNVFHWHLTDDQGWRIQIKGLPALTNIGAWRVLRTGGSFGDYEKPQAGEKATYGGFYTEQDIKDIVKYAADRYITIVPEIDVPAHSKALIASFPNLSCQQEPAYVNPGSPLNEDEENVLCVANDSTYLILDKIFTQVAEMFPGAYIHLGGDEAYKGFWARDPKDQKLMAEKHLKNTEELQSYFIKKVVKIINSKGKKVIGWEEIMQGGLTPGTVLQSWTSVDAGIKAAAIGHQVIMSPWDQGLYMDHSPLKRSYSFDPVPDKVDPKFILGGEGCLWTEDVPHFIEAQKMYWPRLLALSEVFWSQKVNKDYNEFSNRVEGQLPRLEAKYINYSKSIYDPRVSGVVDSANNTLSIKLQTELNDLDIYYTFDGTDPGSYSLRYTGGLLAPPMGATDIKAVSFRNGKQSSKIIKVPLKNLKKRWQHSE
ncbi:MAG: family 20 glycosylhydrolase [Ginsengibacter sp.]